MNEFDCMKPEVIQSEADALRDLGHDIDHPAMSIEDIEGIQAFGELAHYLYFNAAMNGDFITCDRALAYRDRIDYNNPSFNRIAVNDAAEKLVEEETKQYLGTLSA
ncbi:MAG TPA: hypothetical protein PKD19_02120 [Candidatus Saccharibacteria bacterium]|jgi:hypothetical protein|nr:hypothetical protein [Candidatus Saccharibacteria bacterium]HMR38381.1 hypothetical protein [Candidatus Saccharibacteria bacterium]